MRVYWNYEGILGILWNIRIILVIFHEYIHSAPDIWFPFILKYALLGDLVDGNTVCAFCLVEKRIFRSLTIESTSDSPLRIYNCLALFAKHFRQGWQEDAHEFLRYVIEACNSVCIKLHKLLSSAKLRTTKQDSQKKSKDEPRTIVKDIFGGVLQSQVKCLSCSAESNKLDDIMDLSLDVFKISSLNDAMCRYFQPEILDGSNKYRCEKWVYQCTLFFSMKAIRYIMSSFITETLL